MTKSSGKQKKSGKKTGKKAGDNLPFVFHKNLSETTWYQTRFAEALRGCGFRSNVNTQIGPT